MAFKMRSGNKISFKNMGSSPAKQEFGLIDKNKTAADVFSDNQTRIKSLEDNAKLLEEARKQRETIDKGEKPTVKKLRDISKKEEQESRATDDIKGNEGAMYEGASATDYDKDLLAYKSKEQIKQDRKTRKLKSKTNTSGLTEPTEDRKIFGIKVGTKQYTKAEKARDKDAYLADRLRREKGTGKNVYGFNFLDALMGDNIASGLTYGAKHKKTQKKIDKRAKKVAKTESIASGKAEREAIRDAAKK